VQPTGGKLLFFLDWNLHTGIYSIELNVFGLNTCTPQRMNCYTPRQSLDAALKFLFILYHVMYIGSSILAKPSLTETEQRNWLFLMRRLTDYFNRNSRFYCLSNLKFSVFLSAVGIELMHTGRLLTLSTLSFCLTFKRPRFAYANAWKKNQRSSFYNIIREQGYLLHF
jgi:hypothetical protein